MVKSSSLDLRNLNQYIFQKLEDEADNPAVFMQPTLNDGDSKQTSK